jgi:hypothetical protein
MAQPQPNIANINAAINGMAALRNNMAQGVQAYNALQGQFDTELSRCANYPVVQMQQQLVDIKRAIQAIQQAIQQASTKNSAE